MNVNDIYRDDVDPAFIELVRYIMSKAGKRRLNDCANHVNLLYPTDHPRGYYSVLKLIRSCNGIKRSKIYDVIGAKVAIQIIRLEQANMIANVNHKFHVTNIGEVYCLGAENVKIKHIKVRKRN